MAEVQERVSARTRRATIPRWLPVALIAGCWTPHGLAANENPQPLLQNPGFEEGKLGWSEASFVRYRRLIATDNQQSRSGNVSLRIGSTRGVENPRIPQSVPDLRGGAAYVLRVWIKGDGKTVPSLAGLGLEFYNAAGEITSRRRTRKQPQPGGEWSRIELGATADPDAVRADVVLQLFGPGTVWFDDLELVMAHPPPALALRPARQAIPAGDNATISLVAHLAEPWETEGLPPLKFTVFAPNSDAPIHPKAEMQARADAEFSAALLLPRVDPGAYRIACELDGTETRATAWVFVPLQERQPSALTDTGVILVEGEPFFPIGLYHVGPQDYPAVAKQGFNCVQGSAALDTRDFGTTLDAAKRAALLAHAPLYANAGVRDNLTASVKKLNRHRNHPALLSWKIIDEPEAHPDVADEVPPAYATLRVADPAHPLALAVASPDDCEYWANFCDILQVKPFPIPTEPLTIVSDFVSQAKGALAPWQNLTVVLQAGWQADPLNQPTFAQARVMLYLALISGAKGVFWYCYRDPGWRLDETPLWDRLRDINRETAALANPIMLGAAPEGLRVTADGEGLQWTARELGGRTFVLLANPGTQPLHVTITPASDLSAASCLHGKPPETQGDKVVLDLSPLGAETVILAAPSVPQAAPPNPETP